MQLCRSDGPCSTRTPVCVAPCPALPGDGPPGLPWGRQAGRAGQAEQAGMGLAAGEHQQGYKKQKCFPQQQDTKGNACQPGREGGGSGELARRAPSSQAPSPGWQGAGDPFASGHDPKG